MTGPVHHSILAGGGEMGELMRSIDWSRTPVGPVEEWPQSLRTALSILMETGFPMYIAWGPDFTQFYNDGFRPILGSTKHPAAMGIGTPETFSEIWDVIGPMFHDVMRGRATTLVDFQVFLDRHGFAEECYFFFSYSPIREESGRVGGVLTTVTETSQRVIGERRLKTTQALVTETRDARAVADVCEIAAQVLSRNSDDLPWLEIQLAGEGSGATCSVRAGNQLSECDACGIDAAGAAPDQVVVVPIADPGRGVPIGRLTARTSPHLRFDAAYRDFLTMIASQIGTVVFAVRALEDAQTRADALAELNRAKTAFFSNVSHEFRTPLTLMLGPTEQALAAPDGTLGGDELIAVHRNALRLLRLVNTLLDFSRIEAGRVTARYQPTDLARLTTELASAFESATARAGLTLAVQCPPLTEPAYVDTEMWEKIVLNLLSNAFKFTFAGTISVGLEAVGGAAELRVRDTGVGVPAQDLERIFDRFFRIERSAGRTNEGSGIGLALVSELVTLHGGTITATSDVGQGTEFTVRIPLGHAHLPSEFVEKDAVPGRRASAAREFVDEAIRWLPGEEPAPAPAPRSERPSTARILVADDNADMRDYLSRLLASGFEVRTAADGAIALEIATEWQPDLILSDVMMPRLDGFELLRALRSRETTRSVPFIMLSARAGEEARIDGLHAGADEYLVKPFSARELIARVEAQLTRARLRSLEDAHATRLESVFRNAPVGVAIVKGSEHRVEFTNAAYDVIADGRAQVGMTVREVFPELESQPIIAMLDQAFQSGEVFSGHSIPLILRRPDGHNEENFYDFVLQPQRDESGHVTGLAIVVFDVSALTIARGEAESANRAKDEFLALLGHELRNPLAPIVTALEVMRLSGHAGAEHERQIIERQVQHVVSLVEDLLDISRITRGEVSLRLEPVDLADVTARALEMAAPVIERRRHALRVDVPHGMVVSGDASRLAQVVANLLTNAAKYSDEGGRITVSAKAVHNDVVLTVSDEGRGISAEMLPRIFDLFWQERQELDRREGGLGLGLAIVRTLVERHDGRVEAESGGRGKGATFRIILPATTAERAPAANKASRTTDATASRRVLVVDDNVDAAELLVLLLTTTGHVACAAFDGPAGLVQLERFKPDVVLLDLGLPVMDGYEVARRIRKGERGNEMILIAVTGYGRSNDRDATTLAGFDHHFVKPVDFTMLEECLRRASPDSTS
ncbi:MAG: ATP-binding protein [Gemmatimonadales bacterium]